MNRAIKILEKIHDDLITEIGDLSVDYGKRESRTVEQETEILALLQFSKKIYKTIQELHDYMVELSKGGA